ncbi:hypothetical protein V1512DRAFT_288557 [Lipomyces arxii]|uniref:uncharacterized protein n=1 Tax=Lipomyces arxii TaxID=56418 RepID=UPI0034CE4C11
MDESVNGSTSSLSITDGSSKSVTGHSIDDGRVHEILQSDIGVTVLLKRLKASIGAGKEFVAFLKKRESLERANASSQIHLVKATRDNLSKLDKRDSSFLRSFNFVNQMHDRLANFSLAYASELGKLHEDLSEMCKRAEKNRKIIKDKAMKDEKNVSDAEQAAEKMRQKYYSLCEELVALKHNDPLKRGTLKFKSNKNTPQVIDEMGKKVASADLEYHDRVITANNLYNQLIKTYRPENIANLQSEMRLFDSCLALHFTRYTNVTERLALSHGLTVSPMKADASTDLSLSDLAKNIDIDDDFVNYILRARNGASLVHTQVVYRKHNSIEHPFKPEVTKPASTWSTVAASAASVAGGVNTGGVNTGGVNTGGVNTGGVNTGGRPQAATAAPRQQANTGVNAQPALTLRQQQPPPQMPVQARSAPSTLPYPAPYASPITPQSPTVTRTITPTVQQPLPGGAGLGLSAASGQPLMPDRMKGRAGWRPSLEDTMQQERVLLGVDGVAAPIFVIRAIEAVEKYGLDRDRIYSAIGTHANIDAIYQKVWTADPLSIDFDNPASFGNDIYALATVLKMYFRQLPETIFTNQLKAEFAAATEALNDEDRQNGVHAAVNTLPNENYTTLKCLVIHLYNVQQHYSANGMTANGLGAAWGASLAATEPEDTKWCSAAMSILLQHCYDIFDPD